MSGSASISGLSGSGVIRVSAVVFRDANGAVLTVRKQGAQRFMLPGGKPEPGESARQTAVRECAEEIGVRVDADELTDLGEMRAEAANEPGCTVSAAVFTSAQVVSPVPDAEIAEVRWVDPAAPGDTALAPLLRDHIFPALAAKG